LKTELGLVGQEKNPMVSLAAYLSDWKDTFASDGKGNFSLKKQVKSAGFLPCRFNDLGR
jgi:hypothetical protein